MSVAPINDDAPVARGVRQDLLQGGASRDYSASCEKRSAVLMHCLGLLTAQRLTAMFSRNPHWKSA